MMSSKPPFPNGFRIVKLREAKSGDRTFVFMPDLIRTGLHLQTHPREIHFKTPNPERTTVIEGGIDGILGLTSKVLPVLLATSRPPTPGFKMTGQIMPATSSASRLPFEFKNDSVAVDIEGMAGKAWNFMLDDSSTFVETFQTLRAQGWVGPGDLFFATTRPHKETCSGMIVDSDTFPPPQETPGWARDFLVVRRRVVETGIFFLTMGKIERSLLREVIKELPALSDHVLPEISRAFELRYRRRSRGNRSSDLAKLRHDHGQAAGRRPRRRISRLGVEKIE